MAAMSEEPLQAAKDDDNYDYTADALKLDESEEDLGEETVPEPGAYTSPSGSSAVVVDDVAPEDDGTGIHTAEDLMDAQWDDDLR